MESFELPDNDAVDFTLEEYEQPNNDEINFTPTADEPTTTPETDLDIPTVMILSSLVLGSVYASHRLRSMLGYFGVVLMIVAISLNFVVNLPLMWFWFLTIVQSIIITLAYVEYTRARVRKKN